uniref:Uncharacterized protein n=1 Tax=Solanum tuberosum TaxID=4113 RepID=M1CGH2_SOLTU
MGRSSSVNRLLIRDSALKYSVFSCPSCQPKSSSYTFPDNLHVFHLCILQQITAHNLKN